ncbi:hypothetical protein P23p74 [Thermus phage P23-45]|uniref:Uncharacterized protein n=1 Tax=Thermus virus P23-45 TaxID=2914006 RepID=A7XXA5_BP234|nr:hypothetical protein P23p74 [Thermus phage P23-45]ABU96907.1 hypothetical protein P23p74 [Thermus phage P23-45]
MSELDLLYLDLWADWQEDEEDDLEYNLEYWYLKQAAQGLCEHCDDE